MKPAVTNYDAPEFRKFPMAALIVGVLGVLASLLAVGSAPETFFKAYLLAYVFWLNIALGSLLLLMIQHLTGGAWGLVIRRILESATRTLPLMALLFIPIVFGMQKHQLYDWADPELVKGDAMLEQKAPYLNPTFFIIRAVVYFAIWIGMSLALNAWSLRHDKTADHRLLGKMATLSGPGVVLFTLTVTFASVDWIMSLDPHWYSTIYGALIGVGQMLGAHAFVIAVLVILSRYRPLNAVVHKGHFHDLGKLLLAFVMLWAYLSFSQLLIIWSGNLAEEVPWYLKRFAGGYQYVAIAMVVMHFVLPFILLLSRDLKRNPRTLILIALWVVVVRIIDLYWFINPGGGHGHGHGEHIPHVGFGWIDLATLAGIGGLWLAAFVWQLSKRPLIPANDPYLQEALVEHGH